MLNQNESDGSPQRPNQKEVKPKYNYNDKLANLKKTFYLLFYANDVRFVNAILWRLAPILRLLDCSVLSTARISDFNKELIIWKNRTNTFFCFWKVKRWRF